MNKKLKAIDTIEQAAKLKWNLAGHNERIQRLWQEKIEEGADHQMEKWPGKTLAGPMWPRIIQIWYG